MGLSNGFEPEDIERRALSCMMQWDDCFMEASASLLPEHFLIPRCRTIFAELLENRKKDVAFDLILFTKHMDDRGKLLSIRWRSLDHGDMAFRARPSSAQILLGNHGRCVTGAARVLRDGGRSDPRD